MPVLASVGTAVPPHTITQAETREFAHNLFRDSFPDIGRLLPIFESAQIDSRHFCVPLDWFTEPKSWEEKNALYLANAVALGTAAIENCLRKANLAPQEIDHLVFVSSTGLSTPSVDARLFNALRMRHDLKRTPLWGLGCAGGAAGLARGFDLAAAHPNETVLVLALELCGLTFIHNDRSKSNLVATSLFADGAAAVLLHGDEAAKKRGARGPRVLASQSTIWPDTLDVMGWDIRNEGLQVIFSRDIPTLVLQKIRPEVERFLKKRGYALPDLTRLIAHPGGMKVLAAYEQALDLPGDRLAHAREVLRTHGNMSSGTVLFVLERELQAAHASGDLGLVLALGPGFACEQVLLQW